MHVDDNSVLFESPEFASYMSSKHKNINATAKYENVD